MSVAKLKKIVKQALPTGALDLWLAYRYRGQELASSKIYQDALSQKVGIEIGGPSPFFKYVVPIYPHILALDSVNFSSQTMWEGSISAGASFNFYKGKTGNQFISEASDLSQIRDGAYEFLISSNCLEHIANPLKALKEWRRVVAPGGYLLLVLPNKASNFDHKRKTTTFAHLREDFEADVSEHDMTHLPEILEFHDLSRDKAAGDFGNFKSRSQDNFNTRGLHHHVFDLVLMKELFDYFSISLIKADVSTTDFIALGRVESA